MKQRKFEDLLQTELIVDRFGQKLSVSVFLIDHLLIDTGPFQKKQILIPLYKKWAIEQVVLTHHHEDHTGLASWLQSNKHVPIHTHPLGVPISTRKERLPLYRFLFWGNRERFQPLGLDRTLETSNYVWEIIHTPGHAPDHASIYNKEKGWIFGGDLYVQSKPKSAYTFEDLPEMIRSLEKLLTYDFETYICSHSGIISDGKEAIRKKRDYLVETRDEIIYLHNKGMTVVEIRKQLFPKMYPLHFLSFFEFSSTHFIKSMLGKA